MRSKVVLKENQDINEGLKQLDQAIIDSQIISFEYTNADNVSSIQEIEPIGLTYQWYNWYLVGYSLEKENKKGEFI